METSTNGTTQRAAEAEMTVDVVIVGAGPVGLTLANYLGLFGVEVVVVEARPDLVDYPRGVGIDDESLRSFQAIGLIGEVLPHVTPNQWMRFLDAKGRVFASIEPRADEFGFPKRNSFIQSLVDRALLEGLDRFDHARVLWSHAMTGFSEQGDGLEVKLEGADGRPVAVRASYLVGCDGGRSATRKALGIGFPGLTESTRWLVVDVRNDPIGVPNSYAVCDQARPAVSIALPHGVRRFEFMLFAGEEDEEMTRPEAVDRLVARFVRDPRRVDYIRKRVYTHHARIADTFRRGRALLAGDAAHLMPVWQGQGYNSGVRDATNLGWKLACVVKGLAAPELLDTYEQERRDHAAAMIKLSQNVGRFLFPTNRFVANFRDTAMRAFGGVPTVRRFLLEQRFKPMPSYTGGVVVHEHTIPKASAVGRLFIQPRVTTREREDVPLDEVLGPWFAVLAWGTNPRRYVDDDALAMWRRLGARFFAVRPMTQLWWEGDDEPDVTVVGDLTGRLKAWFDDQPGSFVVLRPDRFVAGMGLAYDASRLSRQVGVRLRATGSPTAANHAAASPMGERGEERERQLENA